MHAVGVSPTRLVDGNLGMCGTMFNKQVVHLHWDTRLKRSGHFILIRGDVVGQPRAKDEVARVSVVITFDEYPFVDLLRTSDIRRNTSRQWCAAV